MERQKNMGVRNDSLFPANNCDKCEKTKIDIRGVNNVGDILRNVGLNIHAHAFHYTL